ncbi:MAG: NAD(P)-dependent oxidoreductase [Oscillospiraceae bacterium]
MNISMSGIDYSIAEIDTRQIFSFSESRRQELYDRIAELDGVFGCVIISTCNRTEIYLSCADGFCNDPFEVMCEAADIDYADYKSLHFTHIGDGALTHLCLLSCGVKSQIWGEDQIITQVKSAVAFARECHAADSVLEVMFRTAVTCGKRVKTELNLARRETSIADRLVAKLAEYGKEIQSVLVIGNGEIGRLAASALASRGYSVSMTVRRYKHKQVEVPRGVEIIEYADRYSRIGCFDAVASATLSPHHTVEYEPLSKLSKIPHLFFDLAVPRDIEKDVALLEGVTVFDVDTLSRGEAQNSQVCLLDGINEYVDKYKSDFYKWNEYRQNTDAKKPRFPFFLDISGQTALVVGAGKIAQRRISTLRKFDFNIVVVAPDASDEIKKLAKKGTLTLYEREFHPDDLSSSFMVIAATNSRELNHEIGVRAKELGKLVSVADCADECGFFFPAIIDRGKTTVALSGDGKDHHSVSAAAKQLREFYDNED